MKEKILAVERILLRRKAVSVPEIIRLLEGEYGIRAERKGIYDDIAALTRFLPIEKTRCGGMTKYVLKTAEGETEHDGK